MPPHPGLGTSCSPTRDYIDGDRGPRHDLSYAREELVAELASWFVSAETGLPFDPSQHGAYIKSWLRALKKDKNELFRAALAASKATDYLLQVKKQKTKAVLAKVA